MSDKSGGDEAPSSENKTHVNDGEQDRQRSNRKDHAKGGGGSTDSRFTGSIESLKGCVYDIGGNGENTDNFGRITMKIAIYIAANIKGGGEFRHAMKPDVLKFEELTVPGLSDEQKRDPAQLELWKLELQTYHKKLQAREDASLKAFSVILGQCSMAVVNRLESSDEWESLDGSSDVMGLLKLIRQSLYTRSTSKQATQSLQEALDRFMGFRLAGHMKLGTYFDTFKSLYEAYEHLGGGTGHSLEGLQRFLKSKDPTNPSYQELKEAEKAAKEEFLGLRLIRCSDPHRYAGLMADIENSFTRGIDGYPTTLTKAYEMLVNYVNVNQHFRPHPKKNNQGLSFLQEGDSNGRRNGGGRGSRGGKGQDRSSTKDSKETNQGYVLRPPSIGNPTTTQARLAQLFAQRYGKIPRSWMLADSCSSVNIISDPDLLHGIHQAEYPLILHCNAGSVTLTQQGYLPGFPEPVWYHPNGIANILSLQSLTKHYRITMDSATSDGLRLHKADGTTFDFRPSDTGLYYIDSKSFTDPQRMWTLITTVKERASRYTKRQLEDAQRARWMQNIIMHPSDQQLSDVAIHHLRGCPVTKQSIRIASDVFGPNLGSLKGKTVHRPSSHVHSHTDPVPPEILDRHRDVTLATDIMFVNKIPFLLTVSRNLRFVTVTDISNRQLPTIETELQKIVRFADEHVPEIERMVRTLKDRIRSVYVTLPFRHIPRIMIKRLVANAVLWWNALPAPDSVSDVHSPRYLLVGTELNYDKHVRLEFGSYVQTHEAHTNDMRQRTLGAICLGPTGNSQGGHYFMSLTSGDRIVRHRWTCLPMPDEAIARVSQIGRRQGMPSTLTFSNRHGAEILDQVTTAIEDDHPDVSDDDSTYSYESMTSADDSLLIADDDSSASDPNMTTGPAPAFPAATGVTELEQIPDYLNENHEEYIEDAGTESSEVMDDMNHDEGVDDETTGVEEITEAEEGTDETTGVEENTGVDRVDETTGVDTLDRERTETHTLSEEFHQAEQDGRDAALTPEYAGPNTRYRKRNGREPRNNHVLLTDIMDTFNPDTHRKLFCLVTAQMTANEGVKVFGVAGEMAIEKELRQLLARDVMHGVHSKELTREQRRAALRYLMFLKEKRCGTIKGRGCADGRKQRLYKTKAETSSPALSIEALFLSCVIDAYERRYVLTCDIPGAFMQAEMDELLHLKLDGTILEILLRMEPIYAWNPPTTNSLLTRTGRRFFTRSWTKPSTGLYRVHCFSGRN
ncbi:hypothetical protein IV203_033868 [Nitzschia inconspicua]|uniref:Reverse transcriptase Ty1/copia-type domain-containing protein n=1 Tax=Nitzschia inconspicua TaxID=303405 RepID=A0A9K3M304_9STRA|nr:hypothetical protein IV203_033868 [Nitzschia inconspicua]